MRKGGREWSQYGESPLFPPDPLWSFAACFFQFGSRRWECPGLEGKAEEEGRGALGLLFPAHFLQDQGLRTLHSAISLCVGHFVVIQLLSRVRLFATPGTTALQASLSITNSRSPPKPMSIESVVPSNHLILCRPLLLLPSVFPSIRVFSNESALHRGWPKYWIFGLSISPSNEHPGLISFRMDWLDLLAVQGTLKSLL